MGVVTGIAKSGTAKSTPRVVEKGGGLMVQGNSASNQLEMIDEKDESNNPNEGAQGMNPNEPPA
jgi:hypothetical protein